MKLKYIWLLLLLIIVACNPSEKQVESTYPDGKPMKTVYYKTIDGKKDMVKIEYYFANGWLESETSYKSGKKHGKCTSFYVNGKVASQEYYNEGELDGKCHYYTEEGRRAYTANYDCGISDGKWTIYDEKGNKKVVQIFEKGKLVKQKNK